MQQRTFWLILNYIVCLVGLLVTAYAEPHGARYFGLFLIDIGAVGAIPGVLAFVCFLILCQCTKNLFVSQ